MAFPSTYITPDEYLRRERASETRHEYFNGQVFAMAGSNRAHRTIVTNVLQDLANQLEGRPCEVSAVDTRVKVNDTGLYTYPDVVVACNPEHEDNALDTLLNPQVIIEVLSTSPEQYDRHEKWEHYRRLPSLHHCLLLAQDKALAEHLSRDGDDWTLTEVADLDGVVALTAVGCKLSMARIYRQVELDKSPEGCGQ